MISFLKNYSYICIGILSFISPVIFAANQLNSTPPVEVLTGNSIASSSSLDNPIACNPTALANAIIKANNADNSAGGGLVILPEHCTITITNPATVATGLPDITGNVTVLGSGPSSVISRNTSASNFRIFNVQTGGTLKLRNLAIKHGSTNGLGGGIQNAGTLILKNVVLTRNSASNGGGFASTANSSATVYTSNFKFNTTTGVGGGAFINFGVANVYASTFSSNTAPINGGAINTQASGTTTINFSQFVGNTSGSLGGALANLGVLNVNFSTIKFNTGSSGGGIATSNPNVTLVKSIIKENIPDNCNPLNTIPGCVN